MRRIVWWSVVVLLGCGGVEVTPKLNRVEISRAQSAGLEGTLSTTGTLTTGLSTVWLTLADANGPITDAAVSFVPLMTMPTMSHGCPVVGDVVHEGAGVYRGQVVFQMASGDMGTWALTAKVTRAGETRALAFDLIVADGGQVHSFTADGKRYVLSASYPAGPSVGLSPVVVTLHRMQDMMTFVPVDDVVIDVVPEMPAHGHGSSKNVAPILAAPGRYEGVVHFSMPGEWRTTFTVQAAGAAMTSKAFDVTL